MFTKTNVESQLEAEITSALEQLGNTDKTSEDYSKLVDRIAKLHKLKIEEHGVSVNDTITVKEMETPASRFKPVNMDTVLVVAANIFGILWLARYERENVIKAKDAMKFVMKPR